ITPKNIIMIGPTGVGKTEISRRLAKLSRAPFVKVEASKFTEVGYVGRDVESIIRDLAEVAFSIVKEEEQRKVLEKAQNTAEERILDLLLPGSHEGSEGSEGAGSTREKLRGMLRLGRLEERIVEFDVQKQVQTHLEVLGPQGMAEIEGQLKDMFSQIMPKARERKKVTVREARRILVQEAQESLIEPESIAKLAVRRAEQTGIVFIDEIDKICGADSGGKGPDVSREGVQRDLLPLVEGSTVSTKHGQIRTDHILFIASGAFHKSKPSDLMPEFQGRFPIRVELKSLTSEHFVRILTEPKNALTKQYTALLLTEGVQIEFDRSAIDEIARLTAEVNSRTEDIGARRLHTLLEKLLEELSFVAHTQSGSRVSIDRAYVQSKLSVLVKDSDLSRFIL
ncbi:MAG: ATP-dependent protease ATPase subunit HslU, partial [Deltaproteobacteria bacterium]|nr:ATP-dependent protease ATPase subunit HslU [Deltaproteobacteria bacterium]